MCRLCSPATPRALCPGMAPVLSAPVETSSGPAATQVATTKITAAPLPELSAQPGTRLLMKGDVVMVAGKIRKWQGQLLGQDMDKLRRELEQSRDYIFEKAGFERDLFA